MKKHGKASVSVMLALAAVLLVSLCYLSSQGAREGLENKKTESKKNPLDILSKFVS